MSKYCEYCGQPMDEILHGACFACLKGNKRLGPALKILYEQLNAHNFSGKEERSIKNIINCANTLLYDQMWFAHKWNPLGNIKKVLSTTADRPYLTPAMIAELNQIIEGVDNGMDKSKCDTR